jgi:ribose 5-phosphate isomerase A
MTQDEQKRASALAALEWVDINAVLGVGTGSTVNALITLMQEKKHLPKAAVSSSNGSTERLRAAGVEVLEPNDTGPIGCYIDGADECDRQFRLIKGGGGALTREKIIAQISQTFVCMIDHSKRVDVLGRFALPIEVIPMARSQVARSVVGGLGGSPIWRQNQSTGKAYVTDNGNWILDVADLRITDPLATEAMLNAEPGVVCVGLFARRAADIVICAGERIMRGV